MSKPILFALLVIILTIQVRSQSPTVSAGIVTAFAGDSVFVPINVSNFTNVGAITVKIQYDTTVLKWGKVMNWYGNMANNGLVGRIGNQIIIAWDDINGINISDDKLLDLKFLYVNGQSSLVFNTPECEIADVNAVPLTVTYNDGQVSLTPAPPVPILINPGNNSTHIPINLNLDWEDSFNALEYKVQLSTDSNFTTFTIDSLLVASSCAVNGLLNNTQYYWRVNAINPTGTSSWSSAWNFRTVVAAISAPSNLLALSHIIKKIELSWLDNSDNEIGFAIQRAQDSTNLVNYDTVGANIILYTDTLSIQDTSVYYYRIFAFNTDTISAFSNIDSVHTLIPIELVSFGAKLNGNFVQLNWRTATEVNNAGFEVERKEQNSVWKKIGYVNGVGTSTETVLYSFTDYKLENGLIYYRLKQIDFNGSFNYSNEVSVEVSFTPSKYILHQNYPNPFNPSTKIKYELPFDSEVSLTVYSILGDKVATLLNEQKSAGSYEIEFNAANLSNGVYFYELRAGNFRDVKKLVLLK